MKRLVLLVLLLTACTRPTNDLSGLDPLACVPNRSCWTFNATFDGQPSSPSQALLPRTFDYAVTHRSHPGEHLLTWGPFPADHGDHCEPPDMQHDVYTKHASNSTEPDQVFFICNNHMMTALGESSGGFSGGYSVASFWPKQEFDFSEGGVLEFDVTINGNHPRSWFEVFIVPREQMRVASAHEYFPIDETYPASRMVFDFFGNTRNIQIGKGAIDPQGIVATSREWSSWQDRYPSDPANTDKRIRRKMRIVFTTTGAVRWAIQKADGTFDRMALTVPGGLPFTKGLVIFKTHAYTPIKDGNTNNYTFHWDNIRFTGPVVGQYKTFETNSVVYLQTNGSKAIGSKQSVALSLGSTKNPVLFGQIHNPMRGQVLLSINSRPNIAVNPYEYTTQNCYSSGWKSFRLVLDPSWLKAGSNTFTWTIGPRPSCASSDYPWNGFSVKDLEVQSDY
jgi:hypothetical protein